MAQCVDPHMSVSTRFCDASLDISNCFIFKCFFIILWILRLSSQKPRLGQGYHTHTQTPPPLYSILHLAT